MIIIIIIIIICNKIKTYCYGPFELRWWVVPGANHQGQNVSW
jgi:hypothetical protein